MSLSSKRLTILLDSEIKDLFGTPKLSIEEKRHYFSLNDLELDVFHSFRNNYNSVYFVLLLGYFKIKPVVLNPGYIETKEDLGFIANELLPGFKPKRATFSRSQKARIYQRIFELQKYSPVDIESEKELLKHTETKCATSIDARFLFNNCIDYLSRNRIAIPKYTVLQRVVSKAIQFERQRISDILSTSLTETLAVSLDGLLDAEASTPLSDIRRSAKNFTASELAKELKTHQRIEPFIEDIHELVNALSISMSNLNYFASLVDYYTVTKLRRFDKATQHLYLVCYLYVRHHQVIEHMAEGFVHHCRKLKEGSKVYAKDAAYQEWSHAAANVSKAATLLRFFVDDAIEDTVSFGAIRQQAMHIIGAKELDSLCLYLADKKRSPDYYVWEYYDQHRELIEKTLRPIFLALQFQPSATTQALCNQIAQSQSDLSDHGMLKTVDTQFIQPRHQPFVLMDDEVNLQRYEVLLYLLIQSKLDGHLYIPQSLKYRCLKDDLLNDETWKNKKRLIKQSMLNRIDTEPKKLMQSMKKDLDNKITLVGERIQTGDNQNVVLKTRTGKTQWRLPSKRAKHLLNNPFFERIQQIDVADILGFVDQQTQFLSAFEHVSQVQSKQPVNPNNLIAAIVANGTNYGLYRMANISDRSYEELRSTQANYLRLETLNQANDTISNAIANLEIFQYYNIQENALHASADGQKFESRLHTFKTRYSSKYLGTNKGVSALTLVANHAAITAQVIGSNEHESHYILDLVYNNTSDIKPDILSTDTHGVNHVNFALLDLFGYTFAPRYAQFSRVIESLFIINDSDESEPMLSLKKPIRTHIIEQEWETIQRIVISLQQKTTTQAALIRKLSTYSKNDPLLQALTEYDRMIKAMYILEYIDDASLRSYVQRALNRGEAYHQLRRAVASVNGNRFRGSSDQEIDLWNECARLLTNAIIYFNSLILSKLLAHFRTTGDEKKLELVKKVSPVAWVNVNLNGTYSFSSERNVINMADVLRPLTDET